MSKFTETLKLSENPKAINMLNEFYQQSFDAYKIERINYDTSLERSLQHAGVDVMLFAMSNGILHVEEKVCLHPLAKYFFIEFETHNHEGWATDPRKHSDVIVFLYRDFVYAFNFADFREFCMSNKEILLHDVGELVSYCKGDDANLCAKVPINTFLELYTAAGYKFLKEAVAA